MLESKTDLPTARCRPSRFRATWDTIKPYASSRPTALRARYRQSVGVYARGARLGALCALAILLSAAGCSEAGPGETTGVDVVERPYFVTDADAHGPLTLAELMINIPNEVDRQLSDGQRSCFFDAVERRAGEAGDPATLDPDDFEYWGGKLDADEWRQLSNAMKRTLLAQAIVSWAMIDC